MRGMLDNNVKLLSMKNQYLIELNDQLKEGNNTLKQLNIEMKENNNLLKEKMKNQESHVNNTERITYAQV